MHSLLLNTLDRSGLQARLRSWRFAAAGSLVAVATLAASCGTGPQSGTAPLSGTASKNNAGQTGNAGQVVNVAYAGSLQLLNEKFVGPAFEAKTGFSYQGRGGGSFGLSKEIVAGEISPNVFESVGAAPIVGLGKLAPKWYVTVASSPLVVAYSPLSPHASTFKAISSGHLPLSTLFKMMASPGFHLGRTNPDTDPQGQAFVGMVHLAQSQLGLPAGTAAAALGGASPQSQIFAETSLEAHLQAGQLDAASAFRSQAIGLHLPYISLPNSMNFGDPSQAAEYAKAQITLSDGKVITGKPLVVDIATLGKTNMAAADSFVKFALSSVGRKLWKQEGFSILTPKIYGSSEAVPQGIRAQIEQDQTK